MNTVPVSILTILKAVLVVWFTAASGHIWPEEVSVQFWLLMVLLSHIASCWPVQSLTSGKLNWLLLHLIEIAARFHDIILTEQEVDHMLLTVLLLGGWCHSAPLRFCYTFSVASLSMNLSLFLSSVHHPCRKKKIKSQCPV